MTDQLVAILTLVFGISSSALWLASALVKKKPNTQADPSGLVSSSIQDTSGSDVVLTLELQSKLNAWAAFFSALTIACQVLDTAQKWLAN